MLNSTDIKSRMVRSSAFKVFGLLSDDEYGDMLVDSICRMVQVARWPFIPFALTVDGIAQVFALPDGVEQVRSVKALVGYLDNWLVDTTGRTITFAAIPDAGTVSLIGIPTDVRSNIDTILAAVDGSLENVILNWCEGYYHRQAKSSDALSMLADADASIIKYLLKKNRDPALTNATMPQRDAFGRITNPTVETDTVNVSVYTGMDL